ncbi:uncharacterized protein LOC123507273 [Portunus trituberculatus]|uniref:uncharacterized protein LOC123507273 n=1 Tax=Portunus trituberculatus TaxID=210409 RepID=UPI001E1D1A99|nr:uncharacterized protein LOC123507273 [Portunus trituberculatus]
MATSHILVICSIITASSSLELPVRDVPTIADAEFSVLDFIRLSFQPLLITDALQQITLDTLAPWTFPAFHSSIEAATTFCVASKGSEGEGEDEEGKGNNDVPMSLRRFSMEGSGDSSGWQHAFTTFTKELGTSVTLPTVLRDADLAFLDLTKTGVRHSRVGQAGRGLGDSAVVVCVVEGVLSFSLTPLPPSLAALQCVSGQCQVTVKMEHKQDITPELYLLTQTTAHPRACLYIPLVGSGQRPPCTTPPFWSEGTRRERREGTNTLWEALPKGASPPSLLLWGDQNPLLHLLRRYLLSDRHLHLDSFLEEFRMDRLLLPDLVDCSRECMASAAAIFALLDADGDGELTPADATHLTHASFTALTHQMDDFVDELKDFARDQWEGMVGGPAAQRSAFLQRAKDRLTASATATVQRWIAGDLEGVDVEALKEHLPSLHERVFAAREGNSPEDKDEL